MTPHLSERALIGIAVAIGVATAASSWADHGSLAPFLREVGRSLMFCLALGIALDRRADRRQRALESRVDTSIYYSRKDAAATRRLVEMAQSDTEKTQPHLRSITQPRTG